MAATGVVVALVVGATLLELDVHADQVLAVELVELLATTGLVVVLVVLALEVVGLTDVLELELPHAVQASSRL